MSDPFLEVRDLSRNFVRKLTLSEKVGNLFGCGYREQVVHAVDHVSLSVSKGEVLGVVGESGCGKSTIGRMICGLLPPSSGKVLFQGRDIHTLNASEHRMTQLQLQMIFQDPFASLNPRMRVRDIVGHAPLVHKLVAPEHLDEFVDELLLQVGLDPSYKRRYPHQFSGGQRQRVGIARALAVSPSVLVCDESVAALDVSIQAQILNIFMKLRDKLNLTCLFISHDIGVVRHISHRVAIMYLGRLVELGNCDEIFSNPTHPYTRLLLDGVPRISQRHFAFHHITGEIPSPLAPPPGCHFHPRCPQATEQCKSERPALREIGPGHFTACFKV
ncbi:MAG TPA: ABC transporter ATP-binding protein [Candidatus Mailhella merdavium]|nr:ABC transporter ATP-binding protein [Candidatus Mailhella merdavium]